MKCYYKDPKATSEVLKDGWLLTGDMAYEDNDGFIYLVDRKKDVIISGGENLYPVEIENFIRKHDACLLYTSTSDIATNAISTYDIPLIIVVIEEVSIAT